ncbi:MAG: SagB family peptide dehydrogenase [Candidatus Odinarchaeota archaeon]
MQNDRSFLKMWDEDRYEKEFPDSDQKKKKPQPRPQKDCPAGAEVLSLVPPGKITSGNRPFSVVVNKRMSHRTYTGDPFTLEELSFLLWCTQGVKKVSRDGLRVKRTVPSAGSRHSFELYLVINRVDGLKPGLYRYLSLSHELCFIKPVEDGENFLPPLLYGQKFIGRAAVIFFWVTVPYRMEWRYSVLSSKFIALDAGHACQNLYLACESINAGTCAVGYYDQSKVDAFLEIDGENEFTVYVAPTGKVARKLSLEEFLESPREEVDRGIFERYEGTYKRTNPVDIKVIDGELYLCIGDFKELLEPYNDKEFLGDEAVAAIRFVLDKSGKPVKMTVLSPEGDVLELVNITGKVP